MSSTRRQRSAFIAIFILMMPIMLTSVSSTVATSFNENESGNTPEGIWSTDYANSVHPWGGDDRIQFKEYHDYFSMRERMMQLAEKTYTYQGQTVDIMSFHEGMNGGTNARDIEMTADSYEGHFYNHPSPWLKITGGGEDLEGVYGGDCNDFVGDCGNYPDIPDVQMVGNFHAREWMSYEVPMLFLETIAHYYGTAGIDNDGDGLIDEDPWGDANGDGIIDDDGDCLSLAAEHQDSNGDGNPCGPGDLGVDEDFSEQQLTDLVNTREIYLVPMLNVDGNRYDREEFCGENAWETCPTSGWRKNLRDNTVTGVTPLPDIDEEVDEGCDGVDLNRNFQYEWGAPLGATGPLFPGMCYAGQNNDVYNGPVDDTDNDGDGQVNEDHVDGNDDDADGLTDEDWWGGNSEPETLFVQDLTEMNDDDMNRASDFKVTLSWHSFSELVLYPWGHCTNCETPDHQQLIYHGDKMAEMTDYANIQSSDLYPTTGDYCDWQYGLHDSYCYTMEIGTAFHQQPEDVNHIAVRNLGVPFYILEISDNPRERANLALGNVSQQNYLVTPNEVDVPESGDIPIDICVSNEFPYSEANSIVKYRMVKPSRLQSDYGPREWATTPWESVKIERVDKACTTAEGNGTVLRAELPVSESSTGTLHYKAQITTLSGSQSIYPADGSYYELGIEYRSSYGNLASSLFLFVIIAGAVWGGLGACLRLMLNSNDPREVHN
tara:strand:- start:340 stop:2490 length:2151 start_codon:yes stop_codon:yes gene_type:complete